MKKRIALIIILLLILATIITLTAFVGAVRLAELHEHARKLSIP